MATTATACDQSEQVIHDEATNAAAQETGEVLEHEIEPGPAIEVGDDPAIEALDLATGDFEKESEVQSENEEETTEEPATNGAAPPPSADAVRLVRLEEWRAKVQQVEDECRVLNLDVESRKSALKEAKDRFDGKVAELRDIVSRGPDQPQLFDACGEIDARPFEDSTAGAADEAPSQAKAAEPDDSWRSVTLLEAGVPSNLCDKLAEHTTPLITVGDLADFSSVERNRLTDIKGIGRGKAEKIEAAMEKFWIADAVNRTRAYGTSEDAGLAEEAE